MGKLAHMEVSQKLGIPSPGVPIKNDSSILGSILGSPYLGKLPYRPISILAFAVGFGA